MEKIDALFDRRYATDEGLRKAVEQGKVSKTTFRNYYALRAAISFSYGSHDEWNIVRILNDRRRGATKSGHRGSDRRLVRRARGGAGRLRAVDRGGRRRPLHQLGVSA